MPDAFIWYHASEKSEPELIKWLDRVEAEAGVRGELFVRIEQDKSTFMETYADVSRATINRIEKLAASQSLFEGIHRRCESFVRISDD